MDFATANSAGSDYAASFRESHSKLPVVFEANCGQSDHRVQFLARENGQTVFLTGSEIVLSNGVHIKLLGADSNLNAPVALESLATLFGAGLASVSAAGDPEKPPTTLGGISLRVRDSKGDSRLAPLLFVSPGQINFRVPDGTATGRATLEVANAPAAIPSVDVPVLSVAPGLFTLKNNMAAAYGVRIEADGRQTFMAPDSPIVVDDRPVYLVLFGTGLHNRSSLENVKVTIGGIAVAVEYAGPGGGVPGLDQINIRLTSALKAKTDDLLKLTVDGLIANVVSVNVQF